MEKTPEQIASDWHEFINLDFYEFRGDTRKTISDYADLYDLPQAQMSQYMKKNGKIPRSQSVIAKFVKRHGTKKIYGILGYPESDDPIDSLPEPLRSITHEVRETLAEYKSAGDSPEADNLIEEIMKKHGYVLISKKD